MPSHPPTCDTCRFSKHNSDPIDPQTLCVRFPPTPAHGWPTVQIDDWCGEYRETPPPEGDRNKAPVAIISSHNSRETLVHLKQRKDILHLDPVNMRGILSDNSRFIVVMSEHSILGLEFSRYEIIGKPRDQLIMAVVSRLSSTPGQQGDESA